MRPIDRYRNCMVKEGNLGGEIGTVMMFRTGLDLLDFRLAYFDITTGLPRIGIPSGRILYVAAPPSVGKSTLVAQIIRSLMIQYPNVGFAQYYDREYSMTHQRMCTLNPFAISVKESYDHVIIIDKGVFTETIEQAIRTTHAQKTEDFKNGIKVPVLDSYGNQMHHPVTGNPEFVPPPTIIVIDSLYMLTPATNQEAAYDDRTNMDNARIAGANATMLKMVSGLLEEANITLVIVNHIRKRINTTRIPQQALLNYLHQDEHLPGGDVPVYLARTLLKMKAYAKLKPEDYDIDGYRVMITTLKSMTSRAGMECSLIYSPVDGFDNDLSNLEYLRTMKAMDGINTGKYQVPGSIRRFTRKDFKQIMWDDREFALAFNRHVWTTLMHAIPTSSSRVIDMYSANIVRDLQNMGQDPSQLLQEKIRAAIATKLEENEILYRDNTSGMWYARNYETGNTRTLDVSDIPEAA
jgi:RecA/RadA recombinase